MIAPTASRVTRGGEVPADWPHAEASRFVEAGGVRWHVQAMGQGPLVLLVHGTGASTHSWAGLMPLLARRHRVVAFDLPGQGFSTPGPHDSTSLPGMARAVAALLAEQALSPQLVVGHSAGAALLAQMCLDGSIAPQALVSINGALLPLHGLAGLFFAPAARLMTALPAIPTLFARRARDRSVVERLLRDTGSRVPRASVDCYQRLTCSPAHVGAALRMMANWDLDVLARQLQRLPLPLHLLVCQGDRTVPPSDAERLVRLLPMARLQRIAGLGHLGHEEAPEQFAGMIGRIADTAAD